MRWQVLKKKNEQKRLDLLLLLLLGFPDTRDTYSREGISINSRVLSEGN